MGSVFLQGLGAVLLFSIGSCSDSQFTGSSEETPGVSDAVVADAGGNVKVVDAGSEESILDQKSEDAVPILEIEDGLEFGHFDLDVSTQFYAFNGGSTEKHIHEFDDEYNVTGADLLDFADKGLPPITGAVADGRAFRLFIVNGKLSPLGHLRINDKQYKVGDFEDVLNGQVTFSFQELEGSQLVSKLAINFPKDALAKNGLLASTTGCVKDNTPGKNGEYRNGALLLQVADADQYTFDKDIGSVTEGLLWEVSIFWHKDDCYQ